MALIALALFQIQLSYFLVMRKHPNDIELAPLLRLDAGASAGIISMSATYPMDMMVGWKDAASLVTGDGKCKAQIEYTGMIEAFRKTVCHDGFGALYKRLVPNSVKVVPSIANVFVTYKVVKDMVGVEMRISD